MRFVSIERIIISTKQNTPSKRWIIIENDGENNGDDDNDDDCDWCPLFRLFLFFFLCMFSFLIVFLLRQVPLKEFEFDGGLLFPPPRSLFENDDHDAVADSIIVVE